MRSAHNIQFEMDFDTRRQDEIMRRNVFVAETLP